MSKDVFRNKLLAIQTNLLNFAYILTSNREDAYDLLQDTSLKALDNSDKFTPGTNFKGWVMTIMRNIFINTYRHNQRVAIVVDTAGNLYHLNLAQAYDDADPEGACHAHQIESAIESFADEYRVPLEMHIAGYKYAEIGDRLGLPTGTVKSRIFSSRRKLQSLLKDYE